MGFIGVVIKTEQLFLSGVGEPYVLVVSVGNILIGRIVSVGSCMFAVKYLADTGGLSPKDWGEAMSSAAIGDVLACCIENCGHDVLQADGTAADRLIWQTPT